MPDPCTHSTMKVNGFRMHFVVRAQVIRWSFCMVGPRPGTNGGKLFPQAWDETAAKSIGRRPAAFGTFCSTPAYQIWQRR